MVGQAMSPEEFKARLEFEKMKSERMLMQQAPLHPLQPTAQEIDHGRMMKALYQVGKPPSAYMPVRSAEIFAQTIKWHLAMAKVFEYMQTQINFDPFKSDPEAKHIFERVLLGGYSQLHSEAETGQRK